ncbi:MAG TPA: transglutaminase domain-containing protein [Planctomycetota bacterium]|nr:transglutaminase domain-containing protein [Planctomycetota bacterium]
MPTTLSPCAQLLFGCLLGLAACQAPTPTEASAASTLFPDQERFAVENTLTIPVPAGSQQVRFWFPLPREEDGQSIADLKVEAPAGWQQGGDDRGNRYVYASVASPPDKIVVKTSFTVTRRERNAAIDAAKTRPLTDAERTENAMWLGNDKYVLVTPEVASLAAQIRGDERNPLRIARKLYDWTLENVEYWVKDPNKWKASPVGSSEYCLTNRTGNCTDFHSLYTALARASGIPTRMEYGSLFKPALEGKDRDASYHCWPESWFPGLGWVPNDVAVADIFAGPIALDANNTEKVALTTATGYEGPNPALVDYYFGNLDARRVTWTMGRDLTFEPRQAGGPVNANPKGYVEIDGAEFPKFERKMTYHEVH